MRRWNGYSSTYRSRMWTCPMRDFSSAKFLSKPPSIRSVKFEFQQIQTPGWRSA